jgi:hypothetical protein
VKKLLQIIKESDDLDWVLNNEIDLMGLSWVIRNDSGSVSGKEIQQWLINHGMFWYNGSTMVSSGVIVNSFVHFRGDDGFNFYSDDEDGIEQLEEDIVSGKFDLVMKWSELSNTITESDDFDWVSDIEHTLPTKEWDGRDHGTPNMRKLYRYTDHDGDNHLVRVGGIMYKHRTRRHDGTYFSNDGKVDFYDGSVTQQQITDFNNTGENDPFEGKYRVSLGRREYNENIRNNTLVMVPDDRIVNESDDFDFVRKD